jgi:hypothetical protein
MENIPARRKPLPKLKFPLFGDGFASGGEESDTNRKYFMYLFGLMLLFVFSYEYFNGKGDNITKASATIAKVEWKGRVTKKYMGFDNPKIRMFDLKVNDSLVNKIDISADSSGFFNTLMPRDSVFKANNSLIVRIKNYTIDTTFTLQFAK